MLPTKFAQGRAAKAPGNNWLSWSFSLRSDRTDEIASFAQPLGDIEMSAVKLLGSFFQTARYLGAVAIILIVIVGLFWGLTHV